MNNDQRRLGNSEEQSEALDASSQEMETPYDDPLQHRQSALGQQRLPWVIAVVGLLIVIAYFLWFSPRTDTEVGGEAMGDLAARVARLEEQLVTTEELAERLNQMDQLAQQLEVAVTRLDRLESATTQRLDLLTRELKTASTKEADTATKAEAGPSATATPSSPDQTRQHVVKSGETLYQISRKYGLDVDALRNANQLEKTAVIYPGQKLVIPPAASP